MKVYVIVSEQYHDHSVGGDVFATSEGTMRSRPEVAWLTESEGIDHHRKYRGGDLKAEGPADANGWTPVIYEREFRE